MQYRNQPTGYFRAIPDAQVDGHWPGMAPANLPVVDPLPLADRFGDYMETFKIGMDDDHDDGFFHRLFSDD